MGIDPKKRGLASADKETKMRVSTLGGLTKSKNTKYRGFGRVNKPENQDEKRITD